ncbi:MAG: hypothetical protein ABFS42_12550 [Candidatus Krumholzibacteriota bacterium]
MSKFFGQFKNFLALIVVLFVFGASPTSIAQVSESETKTGSRVPVKIEVESDHFELFSISPIQKWSPTGTEETEQCIWVYSDTAPNPYSHFIFVLVAECASGFSFEFRDTTAAVLHSFDVSEVAAGWYGVTGRRPFPKSVGKWQVVSSGKVVEKWVRP